MPSILKSPTNDGRQGSDGRGLKGRLTRALSFARLALMMKATPRPTTAADRSQRRPAAQTPPAGPSKAAPSPPAPRPRAHAGRDTEAEGRKAERARCAGIVMSEAAQRNLPLAIQLATQTDLTPDEAIAVLAAAPPAGRHGTFDQPERAARNPKVAASGEAVPGRAAALARMDRALKQANPSTRQAAAGEPARRSA